MAYVNFVKSKTQTDSLEESKTAPGKIYFPNDNKNGLILAEEVYGVKSNNPNTEFWFGTMAEYSAIVPHNPSTMYCIYDTEVIDNNGYEYVDLDLPSGLKWAKCNIGATSETDYGKYFQWGDTVGYEGDEAKAHSTWATAPFNNGSSSFDSTYFASVLNDIITDKGALVPQYDAAHVNMGGSWRMPTKADIQELFENTNVIQGAINRRYGYIFESLLDEDKYIFLPSAGYYASGNTVSSLGNAGIYWSSRLKGLDTSSLSYAVTLFTGIGINDVYNTLRHYSLPIRGVLD